MAPKRKPVSIPNQHVSKKRKTTITKSDTKKKGAKSRTTKAPARKKTKTAPSSPGPAKYDSSPASSSKLQNLVTDKQWRDVLSQEFDQPYFKELEDKLDSEYKNGTEIFPPRDLIFNAFNLTPLEQVKVVILGQDPYHDEGQAMGLSFSVPKGVKPPPSLKNIYKELARDPKITPTFQTPDHGCLDKWAQNGVLLLNTTLTVEAHKANSHAKFGWQKFTDNVITAISNHGNRVVFILWGGFAQKKEKLVDTSKHTVIKTAHPSPLSVSKFMGCNCFSDCNAMLKKLGHTPMDWSL